MKYEIIQTKKSCLFASIKVQDCQVKEVFIDFVEVERVTGRELANTILHCLAAWGLSLSNLQGQCYDGASNMSVSRVGCSAIVQHQAPMAIYTHCAVHQLNRAVVSACKIQDCCNAESFIGEIARYLSSLPRGSECCTKLWIYCAQQRSQKS